MSDIDKELKAACREYYKALSNSKLAGAVDPNISRTHEEFMKGWIQATDEEAKDEENKNYK